MNIRAKQRPTNEQEAAFYRAFTIIELLVVISIIGILAAIGLPAIRGMNKSNSMMSASRQLLDDINYARQRAIADHTSVYIIFVPPNITDAGKFPLSRDPAVNQAISNLYGGQFTTYALVSLRSVGEQPGRATPRYLTGWRTLPNGVYIATNKFYNATGQGLAPTFFYSSKPEFPFPVATNVAQNRLDFPLPHFGFNYLGQLVYRNNGVEQLVSQQIGNQQQMYIPLARGSIFYARDASGAILAQPADIQEIPAGNAYYISYNSPQAQNGQPLIGTDAGKIYNQIYIDPLTGRARVQRLQIQ